MVSLAGMPLAKIVAGPLGYAVTVDDGADGRPLPLVLWPDTVRVEVFPAVSPVAVTGLLAPESWYIALANTSF